MCDSVVHSIAVRAYSKRRRHHTSAGRLKSMLSETEVRVAVGYSDQRRAAGLGTRRLYFLPTRMYPYPTHGGAGPVSGGHRGRQGSVQNPIVVCCG